MAENTRIVIVGGGIAGLSAAQAARETNQAAQITMVLQEQHLPYYRTRICEVLSGLDAEKLAVRPQEWFEERNIELVYGEAAEISTMSGRVYLAEGSYLPFDELILACGADGNLFDLPGAEGHEVFALRSLADVRRLQQSSGPCVIIGGGLLSLEAAWHLSRTGRPVVVVERGERLLKRQLDEEAAEFLLQIVVATGVRVALEGRSSHYDGRQLILQDGRGFAADTVLFAAGITPRNYMGMQASADVRRGIIVDAQMRTSEPHIWACGDCAEFEGHTRGLWSTAQDQGRVAGINAAGGSAVYDPQSMPYTMVAMGTKLWSFGRFDAADAVCRKSRPDGVLKKMFFEEDRLVGAILIGDISLALKLKKAVAAGMLKSEVLAQYIDA